MYNACQNSYPHLWLARDPFQQRQSWSNRTLTTGNSGTLSSLSLCYPQLHSLNKKKQTGLHCLPSEILWLDILCKRKQEREGPTSLEFMALSHFTLLFLKILSKRLVTFLYSIWRAWRITTTAIHITPREARISTGWQKENPQRPCLARLNPEARHDGLLS